MKFKVNSRKLVDSLKEMGIDLRHIKDEEEVMRALVVLEGEPIEEVKCNCARYGAPKDAHIVGHCGILDEIKKPRIEKLKDDFDIYGLTQNVIKTLNQVIDAVNELTERKV
jgi:hypothetical protein